MENKIQYPEGYRYDSDLNLFKKAVDCLKEMLKNNQAVISYQFIDTISANVFITQKEFEQEYGGIEWEDFIYILNNEIIYLLEQNFEEAMEKDAGLSNYLKEKNVPEEWQGEIIRLKLEKRRYVNECLGGEREKNRYNLKKRSLYKKLSDVDCELCRTIDEEEILYATIRMSVNSTLETKQLPGNLGEFFSQGKEDITFICDKSDMEYLIQRLVTIKQML